MRMSWLLVSMFLALPAHASDQPEPVDQKTVDRMGEAIEAALNQRDLEALRSLIDGKALGLRIAKVQGIPVQQHDEMMRLIESSGLRRLLNSQFQAMSSPQTLAKFMRGRPGNPARALVRLELGENGFEYLEYIILSRGGHARVVDWFQLSTGENVSVTIGGIAQLFTTDDTSLLARVLGIQRVDSNSLASLRKAGEFKQAGKHAEAFAAIRELPASIAHTRTMLVLQASMAMLAKEEREYERILARLAELYSDEPAVAFMLLDHYAMTKDLPRMLAAMAVIEKRVGVDGVSRQLRASAYYWAEDYAACLRAAEDSIRIEPDRAGGYDVRASALVGLRRYPEAVAQYRELEQEFDLQFSREMFDGDPLFEPFVESPAFQQWLPH